jgi:phosphoribosylaminoimidazole-succinocarboxamide synthase
MAKDKLVEGREKIFYYHDQEYALIQHFKDSGKNNTIPGSGIMRNSCSAFFMEKLDLAGIDNHFIKKLNMREQMVQMSDVLPLKITVSYLANKEYESKFGMTEGVVFEKPMIDFKLKNRFGEYATINESQIMNICSIEHNLMSDMKNLALRAGDFLVGLFAGVGIRLVDTTFSIGSVYDETSLFLIIADEISPHTCRLWDLKDNTKLDFEHMESHPEDTIKIYQEIMGRFKI